MRVLSPLVFIFLLFLIMMEKRANTHHGVLKRALSRTRKIYLELKRIPSPQCSLDVHECTE